MTNERTLRVVAGSVIAVTFMLATVMLIVYQSIKEGSIGSLLLVFGGVTLVVVSALYWLVKARRVWKEGNLLDRATSLEVDHKSGYKIEAGRTIIDQPERQIAAPRPVAPASYRQADVVSDPVGYGLAMRLLTETAAHGQYGANGTQIMTQTIAVENGWNKNEWSLAVAWLCDHLDVQASNTQGKNNGVYGKSGKTVSKLILDATMKYALPPAQS